MCGRLYSALVDRTLFLVTVIVLSLSGCVGKSSAAELVGDGQRDLSPPIMVETITTPVIEVANAVGVSGAEIGIFGTGFGAAQGTVSILGASAEVVLWTDGFVKAIVPEVADGVGVLALQSAENATTSSPFTVYTIDPSFLQPPNITFENIAAGRTVYTHNVESSFCYQQPENNSAAPSEFLTDYRCGSNGLTRTGSAQFTADSAMGEVAIVAVELGQELVGDYFFSYFVNGNWYPRPNSGTFPESNPRNYLLEVSADSTNGSDGTWQTLLTVVDNDRSQRTHKLTVPAGGYNWMRMYVTDSNADATGEVGNDFGLREIRLFAVNGDGSLPDSFVIYGDSLTSSNFETIGATGFAAVVKRLRQTDHDMPLTTYGLVGQNSTGLMDQAEIDYDIYDALAQDEMQVNARFWGIALGTNDAGDPASAIGVAGANVTEFGNRLDAAVADLIALGRVPIVARIPDTDESRGGFGSLETKRKILADIDAVTAKYRLIPGPDLYTAFRYNIEEEGSSFFGNDGTHHDDLGMVKVIDLWAESFTNAVSGTPLIQPTSTPALVPTLAPTSTPVATGNLLGDVSCDAVRNVTDALYISQYIVNLRRAVASCPQTEDTLQLSQCDVDESQACDIVDALYIVQCEEGIGNLLCAGERSVRQDMDSADLSLIPAGSGQIAVAATLSSDQTTIGALTVDLHYDPETTVPLECEVGDDITGACNVAFEAGTVRLTGANIATQAGEVVFGIVRFAPLAGANCDPSPCESAEITASPRILSTSNGDLILHGDMQQTLSFDGVPTNIGLDSAETDRSITHIWLLISAAILLFIWFSLRWIANWIKA